MRNMFQYQHFVFLYVPVGYFIHLLYRLLLTYIFLYVQGGSWISTGDEASRFARYAFRRHFIQHAGFRLARSLETAELPARLIDSEVFVLGIGVQGN